MNEDWPILLSFFPDNWVDMALSNNAIKGLRKDKDIENYIRTLLIHIGCGYSMRETVARAKIAGIADISDVALLGRLRKAKDWLHSLCVAMFEEKGFAADMNDGLTVRLFDATTVREPGKTGSLWRIHYSVKVPDLTCDFFKITATKGRGTGESFLQYPIQKGDYVIGDRGYSRFPGLHYVDSRDAYAIVRVNSGALKIFDDNGKPFNLLKEVAADDSPGNVKSWQVQIPNRKNEIISGRICAIRKSNEAASISHEKLKRYASKFGHSLKPETLEFAKYVIVYTNYPEDEFSPTKILDLYRIRWQVELVFKRFKSIAQLGHLPKRGDESSKAWLYGKLFVALLTEKIIEYANSISPWGYCLEREKVSECMA